MQRVVVVGGGIAGLAAARALQATLNGARITVVEASQRVGGKILTGELAGMPVELGADSIVDSDGRVRELCRSVGIQDLQSPTVFGATVWLDDRSAPLPPTTFMGIPLAPRDARHGALLTRAGAMRARLDLLWPRPLKGPDMPVESFVRSHFGRQVAQNMVDPVLAGTRAGLPAEMSLAAALPEVDAAARSGRSVVRTLRRQRSTAGAASFLRPRNGMSALVDNLYAEVGTRHVRLASRVASVDRSEGGYGVRLETGETLQADAVVVAAPAHAAAGILHTLDPALSADLASIGYASSAVVAFAYRTNEAPPLPVGKSGILVPSRFGRALDACTFYSAKWGLDPQEGVILRAFAGRGAGALPPGDDDLMEAVEADLRRVLGFHGHARARSVTRWEQGLPVYRVGHNELVDRIFRRAGRHQGLALAGAAYRGAGVAASIASGEAAAAEVRRLFSPEGHFPTP